MWLRRGKFYRNDAVQGLFNLLNRLTVWSVEITRAKLQRVSLIPM
jgi:hypothetical protein